MIHLGCFSLNKSSLWMFLAGDNKKISYIKLVVEYTTNVYRR